MSEGPSAGPGASPAGGRRPVRPSPSAWLTLSGTTIGSVHVRDELPLQDAVHTWRDISTGNAVVAVADGHGHQLHFRSDTGAGLAVVSALEEVRRMLRDLSPNVSPTELQAMAETTGAAIVTTWRAKVHHHVAAHPFTAAQVDLGADSDPVRAYGSTILAAAATSRALVFWQIGDGDTVLVSATGVASRPLPEDPDLDGLHTTSLCQADPVTALRVAVVEVAAHDAALVFLCSDGFGRSRVDTDGWWRQTGEQLLAFTRERGLDWVGEKLPGWLAEPARVGGDDTTMALLVRADVDASARLHVADTVPAPE